MLFSSNLFLYVFLLPAFFIHYALVRFGRTASTIPNVFLGAISLALYVWGNGSAILALIATAIGTYALSRKMETSSSPATQTRFLIIGIAGNLAALVYYKYSGFIVSLFLPPDRVTAILQHLPGAGSLPVGISFYTFMAISYLVEVRDGLVKPAGLVNFFTYLVMFPHLVAGPIVRYSEIVLSVRFRRITLDMMFDGIWLVAIGLSKKVLLANPLGETADAIFSLPAAQLSTLLSWSGALSYTFQIYFDFSGYTDIAIGLAMLFGFQFPKNFNSPYTATSVTDFWRRWHMTLTRWFRDYVWFPLGANRRGRFRTVLNLFIVFLLCGLWHGAAWTFVAWGAYHAILLAVERIGEVRFHFQPTGFLGWMYMFVFVLIGWVFFRSASLSAAFAYFGTMAGVLGGEPPLALSYYLKTSSLFYLGLAASLTFLPLRKLLEGMNGSQAILARGTASVALLALSVLYLSQSTYNPFIYFRF